MRSLILAVAQPPVHALDIAANVTRHAATVRAAHARVVVFPELSLTGYDVDAPLLAPDDPRLRPLIDACAATDSIALAGAPIAGPHIATLLVDADGARVVYRKVHPHGSAEARFRPGPGPEVIEVDGWRLGLAICRDTGIEEHWAATAELGIDAYVAGVVDEPAAEAVMAERARKISTTYGVWTAIASSAGATGPDYPETAGRSGIWTPDGMVAARAGSAVGEIARATLYAEQLARV
ncbi:carbon-nitrogen hydrolase family protein [Paractinoplanes lichenicola]|uniref:Carbon-nitrogen hydrolase family protein n=1 Tax=Paractinoplanes lichenicola TaxID=2802976 RepID=A0ABS1VMG1_9ACTN|nr:carbon-nitrogen hydrolase family protein [Actinoplanes lichenicola]MBL7254937.1 carbon-nitrogen hydrolase family protein [Actinoplanes lichenicola]